MDLIIDGYIIDAPIVEILTECKKELTNGKLHSIIDNGTWVSITCPFHSGGMEKETLVVQSATINLNQSMARLTALLVKKKVDYIT